MTVKMWPTIAALLPYLSQYLAKLEGSLGVVLLDRAHSPLKLTPAGELFHAYLERQSYLDRQLVSDLRDLQDRKRPLLQKGKAHLLRSQIDGGGGVGGN